MPLPSRRFVPLILAAGLLIYLAFLGHRDITTSHEARVVQVARLMAQTWPWQGATADVGVVESTHADGRTKLLAVADGQAIRVNPWLVPILNGKIRLQKPPLPYWCAAAVFKVAGFGEARARLVPATLAAVGALLVFSLGRMLYGSVTGWLGAGVWLSSHFVFTEFRMAMVDPYLAFFTLAAIWAWVRASTGPRRKTPISWPLALTFYGALGMGMLAKGPVVLIVTAIPLAAFMFCWRRRAPVGWKQHLAGIVLFLGISLPWYGYLYARVPNAMDIWRYESLGELTAEKTENARPWWFYIPNLFVIGLPWTPIIVVGALTTWRRFRYAALPAEAVGSRIATLRNRRRWFPLLWLGVIALFFSFVHQKKNVYLLPAFPAMVLLATQGIRHLVAVVRLRGFRGSPRLLAGSQTAIGCGMAIALLVQAGHIAQPTAHDWIMLAFTCAIAALPLLAIRGAEPWRWATMQPVAYAVVLVAWFAMYEDPKENGRSARRESMEVAQILGKDSTLMFDVGRTVEEATVYLPLQTVSPPRRERILVLLEDGDGEHDLADDANALPTTRTLRPYALGGTIESVARIPLASAPGNARWRLYQLQVDLPDIPN